MSKHDNQDRLSIDVLGATDDHRDAEASGTDHERDAAPFDEWELERVVCRDVLLILVAVVLLAVLLFQFVVES